MNSLVVQGEKTCSCFSYFYVVNFMKAFSDSNSDPISFNFDLRSSFSFLSASTAMRNLIGLAAHQNRCNFGANFGASELLEHQIRMVHYELLIYTKNNQLGWADPWRAGFPWIWGNHTPEHNWNLFPHFYHWLVTVLQVTLPSHTKHIVAPNCLSQRL